jgi:hypothetical protein
MKIQTNYLVMKCAQKEITGEAKSGQIGDAHAQMNMGNGVIMIPHHNFKQPSS